VCFIPNVLGDSENYIMANPMQTPPAIVPEWYLLPYYAILRSIPNKLLGVIAMFSALLILMSMISIDISKIRGFQFKPWSRTGYYSFWGIFIGLMILGAKHVETPYIEYGQICTFIYFSFFLIMTPIISYLENFMVIHFGSNNPKPQSRVK
jgi:ubiquinol-cytochrome c reductase cytochrome b subunit